MKLASFFKRMLCVMLVLAMVCLEVIPGMAFAVGHDHDHNQISFERVDNDSVSAGLIPGGRTEITDDAAYADTDVVRVSIILSRSSTIDAGYSAMDITGNQAALKYREDLKKDQTNMVHQIEQATQADLDVVWNLTLAANIISANVQYGQIKTIAKLPGVKSVVLENQYQPCETKDGEIVPNMATSGAQIGTGPVWEAGYTGAGMRIAVIDTGIDTNHQSLNATAFEYALAQLAAKKGMSKEAYIESLDLLDAQEIASVADELNVTVDPQQAFVSSKIAFAYNYRDFDYDVTHDNDEEGDHGSHVSGIATANSWLYNSATGNFGKALDYAFMQGVAPEAQLLTMKVFGKAGAPYDSDFFAAIEDAIVLGADAINLSLGSTAPGRGHHTNSQYQQIMDSLTRSGVVVSISASNSGAWVENADNGGYLYNTDIGMNTVGQPGAFTNSMCVASVENDGMVGYYFTVGNETIVYIEELFNSMTPLTSLAGEHEYVFIDGVGKEADWNALADVLPGKVAICSRGETNFTEKARLAVEAGAIAVMIYNNASGIIYLDMTEYAGKEPVVSLTQKQGAIIRANSTPVYDPQGNLRYLTGTMNISSTIGKGVFSSEYYTMSDFSSWGVPGSLEMKPEITAPGGNIFSLEGLNPNGGAYSIKSGTSMSAPQVAGMSALLMQYIRENNLDTKTGMDIRHLTQSLLMSTATPILADKDNYYSILQQGAGLANIHDAINADSYVIMGAGTNSGAADGKVKVELFDDPQRGGAYRATFTVHNLTNAEKEINLSADFFVQNLLSDGEFLYMDYATAMIAMNVVWTIGGARVVSEAADMSGRDFNGDGLVNVEDGQRLLDYITGTVKSLSNKDKADVDGDGDIDSHDAYVFLSSLSTTTAILPANGSVEIAVDFNLPQATREQLDEAFPNGTYLQGFLYAETVDTTGKTGTVHSIPVLGFYGNWTDPSMFDVGSWPTFDSGEDKRIPYTGILRGNEFQVRYANDPNYHYTLGGNPVITDKIYKPERNSINSSNYFHGIRFTPIRHADQSRVVAVNNTTGAVLLDQKTGAVNMAYYPNSLYGWQNTMMVLETNFSLKNTAENDQLSVSFTLVPEYYIDGAGNVDWDALGEGATRSIDLVIDNTAPELKGVSVDMINNTMTIVASDNQYIAAAGLYNKTGTRRLAATGSKEDIAPGEAAEYTFSLEGINGKKFLVQVHDYAMNTTTYLIEMQIGVDAGVPDMMAYDLVQRHWTTFTKDFEYNYKVGTPRLEYADHTYYAATIAEHYVFASTNKGELFVMPEDDLSDTSFVVNMGVVLYDMAYNKADGNIYAVTEAGNLVVIDKLSGELTKIGPMPKNTNTLACSPEGVFYFNELGTGRIWSCTLETMDAPTLLMEDPYMTEKDPVSGDRNGTEGNMGMEYDPNRNMICWNSHMEILAGSYITFAYYYEIDPATGEFTRYNDFWHEMSCLMIPDETEKVDDWAKPTDKVSAVSLNKSNVEVIKGTSAKVIANVQPWTATNRDVTWTSADPSIATVDENGVITGIAPGTTLVTAASKLDPTKTASCQVTVNLLHVTVNGTVMDTDSKTTFFSWNMAEDETWNPGATLPLPITSATYSTKQNAFYMMEISEALKMHKIDANGNLLASADNENGIPLWDMAYSEFFSTDEKDMVTSIYYSYLLSAKDPMALDAVGFDMGSMCSYLLGITTAGHEQQTDEEGIVHETEHLILLDNDGYIWDFWVYAVAEDDGSVGYNALYSITGSDLRLELPGYDNMEHMFTSLVLGEDGNLYLSAYTGDTNELYHLSYNEDEERYLAVKIGEMGTDVWPATITSVTVNGGNATNAVFPEPQHTMSATKISREQLAAASTNVRFTETEAERNFKLGLALKGDQIITNAAGDSADTPFELALETKTYELATNAGAYFKFTAPSAGTYVITITPEDDATYAVRREIHPSSMAIWDTQPGAVELAEGESIIYRIRLYKEVSKYNYFPGNVVITVAGESTCTNHSNAANIWESDDNNHWQICDSCLAKFNETPHSFGAWENGKKSCSCGKEVTCLHENLSDWVTTDETNHYKVCNTCGTEVDKAPHSYNAGSCSCGKADPNAQPCNHNYGGWVDGKKTCSECGDVITCLHENKGSWVTTDETNHYKICSTCGEEVDKAAHSYGAWANGKKSCTCGKEVICLHENLSDWVTTDAANHYKVCNTCGEQVEKAAHSYSGGQCSCGKIDPATIQPGANSLVLGNNSLESGKVYTYTATYSGGLKMIFSNLRGSDGEPIIDYVYGRGLRVKIMVNGIYVPRIQDSSHDNETKLTVAPGDQITVELVPVDSSLENNFTVTLNLSESTPPTALHLGENEILLNNYYSFIAPEDGILYTTIKELYYDSSYCSEVSLGSTIVFKINGAKIDQFRNQYQVKAGDEISFQIGLSFGGQHSASAKLDLSYERFYEHPIGSRGNPYSVAYSDCPTETVKIAGGTNVWYRLVGFSADAYLTVTGENAYVIVGGTRVDAVNGTLTVPAYSTLQIGNAGSQEMSYQLSAFIPEGTKDNPKDLVEGDNQATVGSRESYYFDFVAPQSGKMTAKISGTNWMYELFWYAADGTLMQSVGPKYGFQNDASQISVNVSTGQTVVIRVTTMTSSFSQPGGTISVSFQFAPSGGTTPPPSCQHPNLATLSWQYNDTYHWKICDACQVELLKATHSYSGGVCVCGKTDPNGGSGSPCQHTNAAGQWQYNDNLHWQICDKCQQQFNTSSHGHGSWANGKKSCFCGHQIVCDHANVGAWQYDDENHWKICGTCGETVGKAAHNFQGGQCVCGKQIAVDNTVIKEITADSDATNGVVQITWDPAKMTLVGTVVHADYYSIQQENGSITIGYISLSAIPAGKSIVTLTFEAVNPADADVTVSHKQINNELPGECVNHTIVTDLAVPASCTTPGLTEGKHCSVCGLVLIPQEPVSPTGHSFTNYISNNDATTTADGTKTALCDHGCGAKDTVTDVGSMLPPAPSGLLTSDLFYIGEDTISNVPVGTTVEQLRNNIRGGSIRIVHKNALASDSVNVATGTIVQLMIGGKVVKEWTVVVTGDLNCDGQITVSDMLTVKAHILNKNRLSGAAALAADTNGDGYISITDFIQIKAHVLNIGYIMPQ
ncbi:MAG: S8 family serine peptidase [Oscillospiraceae bacterium]|nr:S8 family serine peptidase [Oscillospiraceae bacterium]